MLMRFDPFRDLDRLFDQQNWSQKSGFTAVPMDAYRHGDAVTVHFDLPGVDSESIELTVEKNVLTVKADRHWKRDEGDEILVAERTQGSFTRQLFLGETLDPDRISANYKDGVLTLTIPVAEQAKPRKVQIQVNGDSQQSIDAVSSLAS